MNRLINEVERNMIGVISEKQFEILHNVLIEVFNNEDEIEEKVNYSELFICAKRVEGCSEKSIKYYRTTIDKMFKIITKEIRNIDTDDIRSYLSDYHKESRCSRVTLDNVRRILSTFFSWLEDENYILKSPIRRIKKIKTGQVVRETYSDEEIEIMRDNCATIRDLAILDLLNSTGMRVGELVNLNIVDINFDERECIVLGKGNKERRVYFDAKTKIHLKEYINNRKDNNEALFVSLLKPYDRLNISGVEIRIRELGKRLNISKVHPHKFRRTLATRAIDKGMPIEQVQKLLGHQKIDTTMQYAMVNQNNIKISHKKYIS